MNTTIQQLITSIYEQMEVNKELSNQMKRFNDSVVPELRKSERTQIAREELNKKKLKNAEWIKKTMGNNAK